MVEEQAEEEATLGRQRAEVARGAQHSRQRTMLLGLYVRQITAKAAQLQGITSQLDNVVTKRTSGGYKADKTYCSGKGVESEVEKHLRESVQVAVGHMKASLDGREVEGREGKVASERERSRRRILELGSGVRPAALLRCLLDQTAELTQQVRRRASAARAEQEAAAMGAVRAEVLRLCTSHITACQRVAECRGRVEELEGRVGEHHGMEEELVEAARRRGEAASLRGSIQATRRALAALEVQGKEARGLEERVGEQGRRTEELCGEISLLVAREHLGEVARAQAATLALLSGELTPRAAQAAELLAGLGGIVARQAKVGGTYIRSSEHPCTLLQVLGQAPAGALTSSLVQRGDSSVLTVTHRWTEPSDHQENYSSPMIGLILFSVKCLAMNHAMVCNDL